MCTCKCCAWCPHFVTTVNMTALHKCLMKLFTFKFKAVVCHSHSSHKYLEQRKWLKVPVSYHIVGKYRLLPLKICSIALHTKRFSMEEFRCGVVRSRNSLQTLSFKVTESMIVWYLIEISFWGCNHGPNFLFLLLYEAWSISLLYHQFSSYYSRI